MISGQLAIGPPFVMLGQLHPVIFRMPNPITKVFKFFETRRDKICCRSKF
jgi:hypothetical protein